MSITVVFCFNVRAIQSGIIQYVRGQRVKACGSHVLTGLCYVNSVTDEICSPIIIFLVFHFCQRRAEQVRIFFFSKSDFYPL
jgi:hypothetical protein